MTSLENMAMPARGWRIAFGTSCHLISPGPRQYPTGFMLDVDPNGGGDPVNNSTISGSRSKTSWSFKWLIKFTDQFRGPILLLILSPLAVAYSRMTPAWDELFYLHNGVCISRNTWTASVSGVLDCLSQMSKSPLMGFVLIPAGPIDGSPEKLSAASFLLAVFVFAVIFLLSRLTELARIPAPAAILAAISAIASPPLWSSNAPFLVDGLLSVVVASMIVLLFAEWESPTLDFRSILSRSIIWAIIISVGILSKTTFLFIAATTFPAALIVCIRKTGLRITLLKIATLSAFSAPALYITIKFGHLYFAHAQNSSFGPLSAFYDDHLSRIQFLRESVSGLIPMLAGSGALIAWAIFNPASKGRLALSAWAVLTISLYLFVAAGSPNKDPRFFWLVWLTIPLALAGAIVPGSAPAAPVARRAVMQIILILALSIPSIGRMNLSNLSDSIAVLERLPAHTPASFLLVTDDPHFNINSMLLAKELKWKGYSKLNLDTVVYDIVGNNSPTYSLSRLSKSDYAAGRMPVNMTGIEWTNRNAQLFMDFLKKNSEAEIIVPTDRPIFLYRDPGHSK
ncbi:MAG: hypothetical protein AB1592_11005 [Pseudomonadota bacterium]